MRLLKDIIEVVGISILADTPIAARVLFYLFYMKYFYI